MLGKLMKYEIKATARMFLPLFAALLILAVVNRFLLGSGSEISTIISMAIYVFIMIGMFVMTLIVTLQRFYRNLLSEEGYLMFTLPVRPWQHIISKMLIAMMWVITSSFVAVSSIILIGFRLEHWQEISRELNNLQMIIAKIGVPAYTISLEIVINMILGLMSIILVMYASLAIGHLFNKHRILAYFGAFILLNTVTQLISFLLADGFYGLENSFVVTADNYMYIINEVQSVMLFSIVLSIVFNIGYFLITNYVLSKRLNLD